MKMKTLTQVNAKATYDFDPRQVAFKRPKIQIRITHAISIWSSIETLTANVVAYALQGDMQTAVEMYSSITSAAASNAALKAAVRVGLRPEYSELFSAIWMTGKELADERHRLAHWILGYSKDIRDALLLFNPKDGLKRGAHNISAGRMGQLHKFTPRPINKIRVVSIAYLDNLIERLLKHLDRLKTFDDLLSMLETEELYTSTIQREYDRLCSEPRILETLTLMRSARKSKKAAPPRRRRPKSRNRS